MASNTSKNAGIIAAILALVACLGFLGYKTVRAYQVAHYPRIEGAWEGVIKVPQAKMNLRIVVKVTRTNGVYYAAMDSIDQAVKDLPFSKVAYEYPALHAEMDSLGGSYDGKLSDDAQEIVGKWKQRGANLTLVLKRTARPDTIAAPLAENDVAPRQDSDLQGFWKGTLSIGTVALRLNLKFAEQPDGTFKAELDSVDQGMKALPASSATYERPMVKLGFVGIGGSYEGEMNSSNSTITGTWKQGGKSTPLVFSRASLEAEQTAEAGKTYDFSSPNDLQGHWLGTLDMKPKKLRLQVDIAKSADGVFSSSLVSLDQTPAVIPASEVQFTPPKALLKWGGIGGSFEGTMENGVLVGMWKQGGGSIPLRLERTKQK